MKRLMRGPDSGDLILSDGDIIWMDRLNTSDLCHVVKNNDGI